MWREGPLCVLNISTGRELPGLYLSVPETKLQRWCVRVETVFVQLTVVWRLPTFAVKLPRLRVSGKSMGILGIFHQNAIKKLFPPLCSYPLSLCSNKDMDSKLAPPEKAIRSDNFSEQIPRIPQPPARVQQNSRRSCCLLYCEALCCSLTSRLGRRRFGNNSNGKYFSGWVI